MKGVRNLLEDSKWNEASSAMSDILQQALGFYKDELAVGMAEVISAINQYSITI
jgi:hypothetical protein